MLRCGKPVSRSQSAVAFVLNRSAAPSNDSSSDPIRARCKKIEKRQITKKKNSSRKTARARRAFIHHDIIDPAWIAERMILLFLECIVSSSLSLFPSVLHTYQCGPCTWLQFVFEFGIPGPAQRRYVYVVLVINSSTAHASSYVRGQSLFTRLIERVQSWGKHWLIDNDFSLNIIVYNWRFCTICYTYLF